MMLIKNMLKLESVFFILFLLCGIAYLFINSHYILSSNYALRGLPIYLLVSYTLFDWVYKQGIKFTLTDYFFALVGLVFLASGYSMGAAIILSSLWYRFRPSNLTVLVILLFGLLVASPVLEQLIPGLQYITTFVTGNLLDWFGYKVLFAGTDIYINTGHFIVEDSCSGFRYFIVNMTLLAMYALLSSFTQNKFIIGLLLTIILSLILNWVRVFIILIFAAKFDALHYVVAEHAEWGKYLYVIFLFPLFYTLILIDKSKV